MKIGIGFDIHKLIPGRPMMLGGVNIPYPKGPEGHSDGDPLIHAICDSVLGAIGKGDIGTMFPDDDPSFKDIPSERLLARVADVMKEEGLVVANLDCIVMAEKVKVAPYREDIRAKISAITGIPEGRINVKGKTFEGLGNIGEDKAVAAQAVVLLEKV